MGKLKTKVAHFDRETGNLFIFIDINNTHLLERLNVMKIIWLCVLNYLE